MPPPYVTSEFKHQSF